MNIFDRTERSIVCISNKDLGMDHERRANADKLVVGEIYTLDDVVVEDWYSDVYLKEFPDLYFNSVLFEEIEG